jgi:hypothetical protein
VARAQVTQAVRVVEGLRQLTALLSCEATRLRASVHLDVAADLLARVEAAFTVAADPAFARECLRRVSPTAAAQIPAMDPDSFAAAMEAISRG